LQSLLKAVTLKKEIPSTFYVLSWLKKRPVPRRHSKMTEVTKLFCERST